MKYILFAFVLVLSTSSAIYGQTPVSIDRQTTDGETITRSCDNDAGSIGLGQFSGQSNHVDLDTIFLCFGDMAQILHNGDFDLSGDPSPNTEGGIGYAWYECSPTITGFELNDIVADPCLLTEPPPAMDLYVYVDDPTGDAWFENSLNIGGTTTLQEFFNNGDPLQLYFAPITFDRFENNQAVYEGNPPGECVNVRVDQAFSIVYLNPISIEEFNDELTDGQIEGSMVINGGLPEFDGSDYEIVMQREGSSDVADVVSTSLSHGELIEFTASRPGNYIVTISDGKSCSVVEEFYLGDCLEFVISDAEVEEDEEFCLEVSVNNFDSLFTISGAITWNPTVIEFIGLENENMPPGAFTVNTLFTDNGWLSILWEDVDFGATGGQSLPDGTVVFELCFRAVGNPGQSTFAAVGSRLTTTLLAVDYATNEVGVNSVPGKVEIIYPVDLGGYINSCGTPDGESDGSISVTAYGGQPPYNVEYQKTDDPGVTGVGQILVEGGSFTFTDLPNSTEPGEEYEVIITDADGDEVVLTADINNQPGPVVELFPTPPTCFNSANGRIETEIDAVEPYTLQWSNNFFGDTTLSNLEIGNYQLTVTDPFGCEVVKSANLFTDELLVEANITDALCRGVFNGEISVVATGGTPYDGDEYRYNWPGSSPQIATTSTLSNLVPGTYELTVNDSNGCSVTQTYEVGLERNLILEDTIITNVTCGNDNDGQIVVTAGTDTPDEDGPYIFIWTDADDNPVQSVTAGNQNTVSNLSAGTYFLTLLDNYSSSQRCEADFVIEVGGPPPIVIEIEEQQDEGCDPGNDGLIRVSASGGNAESPGDFSFEWSNGETGAEITGLSGGSYTVTVTDPEGCTHDETIEIGGAIPPVIEEFETVNPGCGDGNDGAIKVIYSFGTSENLTFSWEDEDGNPYIGDSISGLSEGLYSLTITADDGCEVEGSVALEGAGPLVLDDLNTQNPSCTGDDDGRITVTVLGGSGNYNYEWSVPDGGPNSAVITGLSAGTYSVTISDQSGDCDPVEVDDIELVDPPPIEGEFTDVNPATCYYTCDGSARLEATGGLTAGDFTYVWDDGVGTSAQENENLCPGVYEVFVSDGTCIETFVIEIEAPDSIAIDIVEANLPSCFGDSDGSIEVAASGGAGPYEYQWADGQTSTGIENLTGGSYQIEVTDAMGCVSEFEIELPEPDSFVVTINEGLTEDVSCAGRDDGQIGLNLSGGTEPFEFEWTGNVSDESIALDLPDGLYEIQATDASGCVDTTSRIISVPDPVVFEYEVEETVDCFGETTPIIITDASGGAGGPYQFSINFGELFAIGETVDLLAGNYVVSVFDRSGCSVRDSFAIEQPEELIVDLPAEVEVPLGESVFLEPDVTGPLPIITYEWSPASDIFSCLDCPEPEVFPNSDKLVELVVTDQNGCIASANVSLVVQAIRNVYVPEAFSPNDDGVNDHFRIFTGPGVAGIVSFRVYDRWGSAVYNREAGATLFDEENVFWNGRVNGQDAPTGAYAYMIEVEFNDGVVEVYSGELMLLR